MESKTKACDKNGDSKEVSKMESLKEETFVSTTTKEKEIISESKSDGKKESKSKNTSESKSENINENKSENANENKSENKNEKEKLRDEKSSNSGTTPNIEEQPKNEKNEKMENSSETATATPPTNGNDIGKFLEFVQTNKNNPELMQQLLSIVNMNTNDFLKREENKNEIKETMETNGINIKREEQNGTQNEHFKTDVKYRERLGNDMFRYQPNTHRMDNCRDKQQSSFFKMFEKNNARDNKNEQNVKTTSESFSESPTKTNAINRGLLSTLVNDYSEKKNLDEVKDMLNSMKIRENKDEGHGIESESSEVIKKKHDKLVEDNDEYIIDTTDVNITEGNEVSLNNKGIMNINNNNMNMSNNIDGMNMVKHMCASNNYNVDSNLNEENDFKLYHSKYTWVDLDVDKELINVLILSKFYNPSKIQAFALPIILNSNKNLIAQSQNGSGKTLTFVIGMLSKINRKVYNLQAMCICPTRELSQQNFDVIKNFATYLKINVFLAVPLCERFNKNSGWQLYVGTPGKTVDFLKRRYIDTHNVKLFVLDEADDLIDVKNNMATQVNTIKKFLPKNCQLLLFSATYNKNVLNFADRFAPQAIKIRVRQEDLTLKCVKQYYLLTENDEHKYYYLSELYCSMTISQCVIFVNSKQSAFNLYKFMTNNNHNVTLICADSVISRFTKNKVQKTDVIGMDPKTRDTLMSDFKKGISKVLICTDLLSRGIDIPSISLVINFDLPYIYQGRIDEHYNSLSNQKVNMETYIHRIGRTGRFGTKGMAINFINKQQIPHIRQIEQYYHCTIGDLEFDSELMKTSITKLSI